jgi:hypothetical protein
LRAEEPPAGTTVVVRGGRDTPDKLRSHVQRTARAWSLDGQPLLGISVFLNDEDETGYVWTFLDEARGPGQIRPGVLVVAGDEEAAAVCQVVDLMPAGDGTIVHLRLLPGLVDDYRALVDVAHARGPQRDRDRHRHQHDPPVQDRRLPRLPQPGAQPAGQSRLVGGLAEQDCAGVADEAGPGGGDLQGMVPPASCEERSSPGELQGVVTP